MSEIRYCNVESSPGYRVGTDGSVWSRRRGKWKRLKAPPNSGGYCMVVLCGAVRREVGVHVLVLEAFVGPRPEGMQACHFPDRDKTNNDVTNLRWGTPISNQGDRVLHGTDSRGESHGASKLTAKQVLIIRKRRRMGEVLRTIAEDFGVSIANIADIANRNTWKHI